MTASGRVNQHDVLDIVARIYDASLDARHWRACLKCIEDAVKADTSQIRIEAAQDNRVILCLPEEGDDHSQPQRQSHRRAADSRPEISKTTPAAGEAQGAAFATARQFENIKPVSDHGRARPHAYYAAAASLPIDKDTLAVISVQRSKTRRPYTEEELDFLNGLLPHLQRALKIFARMAAIDARLSAKIATLDAMNVGIVLLDNNGAAVHINRQADAILAAGLGLTLGAEGLSTSDKSRTKRLQELIAHAVNAGVNQTDFPGEMLRLISPDATDGLAVLVTPVRSDEHALSWGDSRICAALFVSRHGAQQGISNAALRGLFGLTPAEGRLVGKLVQGLSLDEVAEDLGLSPHTVRNQLKSVFGKTNTRRQAELITAVLCYPLGLVRLDDMAGAHTGKHTAFTRAGLAVEPS